MSTETTADEQSQPQTRQRRSRRTRSSHSTQSKYQASSSPSLRRTLSTDIAILAGFGLFYALYLQATCGGITQCALTGDSDPLVHVAIFLALALPLTLVAPNSLGWAIPVLIIVGGAYELLQPLIYGAASMVDFIANCFGIYVGNRLGRTISHFRSKQEWSTANLITPRQSRDSLEARITHLEAQIDQTEKRHSDALIAQKAESDERLHSITAEHEETLARIKRNQRLIADNLRARFEAKLAAQTEKQSAQQPTANPALQVVASVASNGATDIDSQRPKAPSREQISEMLRPLDTDRRATRAG